MLRSLRAPNLIPVTGALYAQGSAFLAGALLASICGLALISSDLRAADPVPPPTPFPGTTNALTLREFLRMVIERNESLHSRILEFEITHKHLEAERGIFEPELTLGYDRVENERENTAEQRRSSGVLVFKEKNNIYNAGIEALVPTGARVRMGYALRDLHNNLQDPPLGSIVTNTTGGEYSTFGPPWPTFAWPHLLLKLRFRNTAAR
jgi:hypothetical protein